MKDYGRGGEPIATWIDETTVFTYWECGVSQEHVYREGHTTCRECDADLSEWMEVDPDDDGDARR